MSNMLCIWHSLFRWISRTGFRGDAVSNWLESRLVVAVAELALDIRARADRYESQRTEGAGCRRWDRRPSRPRRRTRRPHVATRARDSSDTAAPAPVSSGDAARRWADARHQSRTTRRQRPRRGCRQADRVDDGRRRSAARGLAARGRHRRDEPRRRAGSDRGRRRRRGGRRLGAPRRRRPSPRAQRRESRDVDGRGEPRRPRHLLLRRRRRRPAGRPERGTRGRRRSARGTRARTNPRRSRASPIDRKKMRPSSSNKRPP